MGRPDVKKEKPYRKAQESEDMKMDLYEKILAGEEKLSLVGLGYVGMPIAVAFARKIKVIGYDLNAEKIKLYQSARRKWSSLQMRQSCGKQNSIS